MKQNIENIREIAQRVAEQNNLFLIDLVVRGSETNRVIEVFIDGEQNVSAEVCALVSREITKQIDENNLLKSYRLDVSSPGVDRPLQYLKQYSKHIGRRFEVTFNVDGNRKSIKGRLIKIEGENLIFFTGKESEINFNDIIKAKVLISFS